MACADLDIMVSTYFKAYPPRDSPQEQDEEVAFWLEKMLEGDDSHIIKDVRVFFTIYLESHGLLDHVDDVVRSIIAVKRAGSGL